MFALVANTPILPGLSPIAGKSIEARFDGDPLSSDGGLLWLRAVQQRLGIARLGIARLLATCIDDPRAPGRMVHGPDEIVRFRMLTIAAGYEAGNDAYRLRNDPMYKLDTRIYPCGLSGWLDLNLDTALLAV